MRRRCRASTCRRRARWRRHRRDPRCPGCGCLPCRLGAADLLVLEVAVALGADRPPRPQQPRLLSHHRIRMNDAKVYPCHPPRVQVVLLDGDGGGDRQPQPSAIGQQGDRADLLGRVGQRAGQPHPQRRAAPGDRQPHPLALDGEAAVVVPDRDQSALAAREPGVLLAGLVTLGGLEPGVAVALEHRPGPGDRQLPEAVRPGQLLAQGVIPLAWPLTLLAVLPVSVQQPRPTSPADRSSP
jgi:hypothetical protein